jgi:hypothetical protein
VTEWIKAGLPSEMLVDACLTPEHRARGVMNHLTQYGLDRLAVASAQLIFGVENTRQMMVPAGVEDATRLHQAQARLAQEGAFPFVTRMTAGDSERGEAELPLSYVTGTPPSGMPERVRLTLPEDEPGELSAAFTASGYDPCALILPCLPPEHRHHRMLHVLTPLSLSSLFFAACELCFGREWLRQQAERTAAAGGFAILLTSPPSHG